MKFRSSNYYDYYCRPALGLFSVHCEPTCLAENAHFRTIRTDYYWCSKLVFAPWLLRVGKWAFARVVLHSKYAKVRAGLGGRGSFFFSPFSRASVEVKVAEKNVAHVKLRLKNEINIYIPATYNTSPQFFHIVMKNNHPCQISLLNSRKPLREKKSNPKCVLSPVAGTSSYI